MNLQLTVDAQLCIGCEECVMECPTKIIEMNEGHPIVAPENEENCIQCQHCLAVCPSGALSIYGLDPANSITIKENSIAAEKLGLLMKGRRSVRRYFDEAVSATKIDFLLKTTAYAPTGINNQQVHFTVIDDLEVMEALRRKVYTKMETVYNNDEFLSGAEIMKKFIAQALEDNTDTIFRGAPHFLIASSPKDGPCPDVDCHIALTYFELLAASMGLGTVWNGMAKWILTTYMPDTLKAMGIPESHAIGYMMSFGKPKVTYQRTVQRIGNAINRVGAIS